MTLDSGLEPMPDEVAIQALCVGHRPRRPGPLHRRRRRLDPAGHRISHPSSTAHRGRPAAHRRRRRRRPSTPSTEFRAALRDCEPTRRRDLLVDHVRAQVAAAMGLGFAAVAGSVGGLLPIRDGFADERDTSAVAERKPRRSAARVCGVRLSDRRGARRLPGHNSSRADRGCRSGRASTPTTTSPKTNCCNNFPKGWVERDDCCTAGSPGDHHRGAAQDR